MDITGAKLRALLSGAAATLLLAGCAASVDPEPTPAVVAESFEGAPSSADSVVSDPLLEALGVDGLSAQQAVDHLDRVAGADRRSDIMASVRVDELVVTDGESDVAVPLPQDKFYLSVAPYLESTHDCFYHSLTTCQGELSEAAVDVTVTTSTGEVLLDEQVTTFDNGFTGFWLPRGTQGTIELGYQGRSGTYAFTTDDDAPTCVTTVRLT